MAYIRAKTLGLRLVWILGWPAKPGKLNSYIAEQLKNFSWTDLTAIQLKTEQMTESMSIKRTGRWANITISGYSVWKTLRAIIFVSLDTGCWTVSFPRTFQRCMPLIAATIQTTIVYGLTCSIGGMGLLLRLAIILQVLQKSWWDDSSI